MGLQTAFLNLLGSPFRTGRVIIMKLVLVGHLILSSLPIVQKFFRNYNKRKEHSSIPQPAYYNSWNDIRAASTIFSLLWVNDLSKHLQPDKAFD